MAPLGGCADPATQNWLIWAPALDRYALRLLARRVDDPSLREDTYPVTLRGKCRLTLHDPYPPICMPDEVGRYGMNAAPEWLICPCVVAVAGAVGASSHGARFDRGAVGRERCPLAQDLTLGMVAASMPPTMGAAR